MVSAAVKEAFPLSTSKKCGKTRAVHFLVLSGYHKQEQPRKIDTTSREGEATPSSSTSEISTDNRILVERIKQLAEEVSHLQQSTLTLPNLSDQLHHVMFSTNAMYHGPKHFEEFSWDKLVAECNQHAPDLFGLLRDLGQVYRNTLESGETPATTEAKAHVSVYTC